MSNFGEPVREARPPLSPAVKLQFLMKDVLKASQVSPTPNLEIIPGNKFFQEISPKTLDEIPEFMQKDIPVVGGYLMNSARVIKENVMKIIDIAGKGEKIKPSSEDLVKFGIEMSKAQGAMVTGAVLSIQDKTNREADKEEILHNVADIMLTSSLVGEQNRKLTIERRPDFSINTELLNELGRESLLLLNSKTQKQGPIDSSLINDAIIILQKSDHGKFLYEIIEVVESLMEKINTPEFRDKPAFRKILISIMMNYYREK